MKKSKCPCRFFILKKRQKKEEANGGNLKVIVTDKPMSHSDGGANPDETEEWFPLLHGSKWTAADQ